MIAWFIEKYSYNYFLCLVGWILLTVMLRNLLALVGSVYDEHSYMLGFSVSSNEEPGV